MICSAVYFDPPLSMMRALYAGDLTLGAMCEALLGTADMSECSHTELSGLVKDPELFHMPILRYDNKNRSSGMVAYALRAPNGGVVAAFRGTESVIDGMFTLTDWRDNFLSPFIGSIQYADIERFIAAFQDGGLLITGHSKGAHNAMYALAKSSNERAKCVCFDGQGFSIDELTRGERHSLKKRAVNNVCESDIVGALLSHPERRVFVKKQGDLNAHELCSLMFSEDGMPVNGKRKRLSYAIEQLSKAYVNGYLFLKGQRVPDWLSGLVKDVDGMDSLSV